MAVLDREIDFSFWLKMAIKILFVMLVPIRLEHITTFLSPGDIFPVTYFYYGCILFYFEMYSESSEPYIEFQDGFTLVAALIVCSPVIYFNRRLKRERKNKSVRDVGLASFFAVAYLTSYFAYSFLPYPISSWIPSVGWDLLAFGSLVMVGLVLLPVFGREAAKLGVERRIESKILPQSDKTRSRSEVPGPMTYSIIGYALGLAIFLFPMFLGINMWPDSTIYYTTLSPLASGDLWHGVQQQQFNLWVPELMFLFDLLMIAGFRILFGYSIIRYLRGIVSRRRVVSYGIIGVIVTLVYMQIEQTQYSASDIVYQIPLPFVFIAGYLAIRLVKPIDRAAITKSTNDVEMTRDAEKARDDLIGEIVIPSWYRDIDSLSTRVKIPWTYVLRSRASGLVLRMKRIRSRNTSEENDTQMES